MLKRRKKKKMLCLCCGGGNECVFYEIFGDVGTELQLSKLLEDHFQLKVHKNPEEIQVLCEECANQLIELYDLAELEKQQEEEEEFNVLGKQEDKLLLQNNVVSTTDEVTIFVVQKISHDKKSNETQLPNNETTYDADDDDDDGQTQTKKGEKVAVVKITSAGTATPDIIQSKTCNEIKLQAFVKDDQELSVLDSLDGSNYDNQSEKTIIYEEETQSTENSVELSDTNEGEIKNVLCENSTDVQYADEFDDVDLEKYLVEAISSNLEDMQFDWITECRVCVERFKTYQDLLIHIQAHHLNAAELYDCVLQDCEQSFSLTHTLARHLLLKHYDVQRLQIYGSCPNCSIRYSNFAHFNKHSCCRTIKRKVGTRNYCEHCDLTLPSFKRYVFHMQFHLTNRRPKVCLLCERIFCDVDEFFEHVNYSHEVSEKLVCFRCDRTFQDVSVFESHKKSHKNVSKYECTLCSKKYSYRQLLHNHMNKTHNLNSNRFQCDICSELFTSENKYRKHIKNHMPKAEVQVYNCSGCGLITREMKDLESHTSDRQIKCFKASIEEQIISSAYSCEFCSLDFITVYELNLHRSSGVHEDEMFICNFCPEKFKEWKHLRMHFKSHQAYKTWMSGFPLTKLYVCNFEKCVETYPDWPSLYHHKKRNHKQQLCIPCNKIISNQVDFLKHKNTCQQKFQFNCQFCSKKCPNKMSLSVHIARSHNNTNIICPHCKASYRGEEALKDHIDYMHMPVECVHCHKTIKNRCNLQTHERIVHKNEQRFFCNICHKGFFHNSERETHIKNVHTNIIYQCNKCEFTTSYAKSLDIHVAMHNKQFEFRCPICDKGFGRKYVLDLHVRRHQTQRQFVCEERIEGGCKSSFVSNYLLNKHIKLKHSGCKLKENAPKSKRQRRAKTVAKNEDDLMTQYLVETQLIDEQPELISCITDEYGNIYFLENIKNDDIEVNQMQVVIKQQD